MASGVQVHDAVHKAFVEIKKDKKYRYIIFYIKDEKIIDIETFGERGDSYDDYLKKLEEVGPNECRYGLYDFEYEHHCQGASQGSNKAKLILMSWCPDTAKIKKKMLYSSSCDSLKAALVGYSKYIQATDMSEASYEAVLEKCRSTDRS